MASKNTKDNKSAAEATIAKMQADAIESIKAYQANTLKTVEAWQDAFAQMAPESGKLPEVPDEVRSAFGDPAAIVDSSYAFASEVLELNKSFAHQLLAASQTEKTTK